MDATQDAGRVQTAQDSRFDDVVVDAEELRQLQRRTARRLSWALAWGVPVIALIVGIWLTAVGSIEQFTPAGDGVFDVTWLAVWPAGLVLLGVGALGLVATALATAVLTTER